MTEAMGDSVPTRAERRAAKRAARAATKAERLAVRRGERVAAAEVIDVHIDEGDPLLSFLADAPGPLDLAALPSTSPAVKRMHDQGVEVVVPLVSSGEVVGVLALGGLRSERKYNRNDKRLLESLAQSASPALRLSQFLRAQEQEVRERQRVEQELQVAQLIQQQFLPSELPDLGGWHLSAFYRPALSVGGDFYDLVKLADGRILVVTGDVTDKGVPAALVMASTQAFLRATAEVTSSPAELLRRVNELLVPQIPAHMFVTCLALVIDTETGATVFSNAGHNLPIIRRGDGSVIRLMARGMPLGLMSGSSYDDVETVIGGDELVLLYSDGITEQHNGAGEMFGIERTEQVVAGAGSGEELVDAATQALAGYHVGVEQEDDITIVALQRGHVLSHADVISFVSPSVAGSERTIMDRVATIVGPTLPDRRLESLKTAVSEIAMNAIEHGNYSDADLDTQVTVRVNSIDVVVEISDQGGGRDHDPELPDLEKKLAGEQTPRGWGMFLVQNLVDKVEEFARDGRHVVRLTMHIDDVSTEGEVSWPSHSR